MKRKIRCDCGNEFQAKLEGSELTLEKVKIRNKQLTLPIKDQYQL